MQVSDAQTIAFAVVLSVGVGIVFTSFAKEIRDAQKRSRADSPSR